MREKTVLVVDRIGLGGDQHAGRDPVGVRERTQHAMAYQQPDLIEGLPNTGLAALQGLFPVFEAIADAPFYLRAVVDAPWQVELELEQFPKASRMK